MLNFGVGPVMMHQDVLAIGSEQIPYFRTPEFSYLVLENERLLKKLVGAPDSSRVIFLTSSGTGAMEAVVLNTLTSKDRVLVVNGGSFGMRFKKICDIYGIPSTELRLGFFERLTEEHLEPYTDKGFTSLLVNVHETSTGVLYNMRVIREFCKANRLFLVADAISSFLADPFDMKDYGVNVTILSSQKALALPPGMSYVIVDRNAQERISCNPVRSLYFNFKDYLRDGTRGQTPYTPAVSVMIQLNRRLKMIEAKGLPNVIGEVAALADDFRQRVADLPLTMPSQSPSNAMTTLMPISRDAYQIVRLLKDQHGIFVAPNGGELRHRVFRVGHLGAISTRDNVVLAEALRDTILKA